MREMLIAVLTNAVWLSTPVVGIAQDQTQIARGIQVYAERKCAVCHSIARKGKQKGALDLSIEDVELWSPNQHAQYVTAGICLAAVYANTVWGRTSYFW